MTSEGRAEAVAAELALAEEELRAAEQLLASGLARIALARTYFAAFHAMRARLSAEGLEPRTHAGALRLFNLRFVKPGLFDPAVSRLLARLQKYREQADYASDFVVDESGAREEFTAARSFVATVRGQLD